MSVLACVARSWLRVRRARRSCWLLLILVLVGALLAFTDLLPTKPGLDASQKLPNGGQPGNDGALTLEPGRIDAGRAIGSQPSEPVPGAEDLTDKNLPRAQPLTQQGGDRVNAQPKFDENAREREAQRRLQEAIEQVCIRRQ